jgi:hypothetical protein
MSASAARHVKLECLAYLPESERSVVQIAGLGSMRLSYFSFGDATTTFHSLACYDKCPIRVDIANARGELE